MLAHGCEGLEQYEAAFQENDIDADMLTRPIRSRTSVGTPQAPRSHRWRLPASRRASAGTRQQWGAVDE
jgi:hypothetical protein